MTWKMLDLFSGIGGFSLAAQWVWGNELEIIAFCEIDKFCQKVLRKHWPNVPIVEDVRDVKGEQWRGTIDILTGGFPCQPFSRCGKRQGRGDERYLWPEMFGVIKAVKPRWCVVENVIGAADMDLHNWKTDLENIGFKTECFDIPASACGLPTMERHLWFISTSTMFGLEGSKNFTYPDSRNQREFSRANPREYQRWALPSSRVCRMGERIPNLVDRLKSLGNAIVPQVAYQIMKAIKSIEEVIL